MIGQSGLLLLNNLTTSQEQASDDAQMLSDARGKGGDENAFARALQMADPSAAQPRSLQIEPPLQNAPEAEKSGKTIQRNAFARIPADRSLSEAPFIAAPLSAPLTQIGAANAGQPATISADARAADEATAAVSPSLSFTAKSAQDGELMAPPPREAAGTDRSAAIPPKSDHAPEVVARSVPDRPDSRSARHSEVEPAISVENDQDQVAEMKDASTDESRPAADPMGAAYGSGSPSTTPAETDHRPSMAEAREPAPDSEKANLKSADNVDEIDPAKKLVETDFRPDGDVAAGQRETQMAVGPPRPEHLSDDGAAARTKSPVDESQMVEGRPGERLATTETAALTEEGHVVQSVRTAVPPQDGAAPSNTVDPAAAERGFQAIEPGRQPQPGEPITPSRHRDAGLSGNVAPDVKAGVGASEAVARQSAVERRSPDGLPQANTPTEAPNNIREPAPLRQDARPDQSLPPSAASSQRSSPGPAGALPTPVNTTSASGAEGPQSPAPAVSPPAHFGAGASPFAKGLSLNEALDSRVGLTGVTASGPARSEAPAGSSPTVAADPKVVTQQITQALIRMDGARTEVTLDPVELGRVSLTFVTRDDGVSVSVVADRPETADLLRRNSEQLQRDLSEAGYEGVELDFDQQDSDQGNRQKAETAEAGKAAAQGQPISYRITHTDAGLDIRI